MQEEADLDVFFAVANLLPEHLREQHQVVVVYGYVIGGDVSDDVSEAGPKVQVGLDIGLPHFVIEATQTVWAIRQDIV